jgi:hypothetical protein
MAFGWYIMDGYNPDSVASFIDVTSLNTSWIIETNDEFYYRIKNAATGRYLNIENHYNNIYEHRIFTTADAPSYWWSSQWTMEYAYPLTPIN